MCLLFFFCGRRGGEGEGRGGEGREGGGGSIFCQEFSQETSENLQVHKPAFLCSLVAVRCAWTCPWAVALQTDCRPGSTSAWPPALKRCTAGTTASGASKTRRRRCRRDRSESQGTEKLVDCASHVFVAPFVSKPPNGSQAVQTQS